MILPDAAPTEKRTIVYDADLGVEAYQFTGVQQRFPLHFHEYYVLGYIERGRRRLECAQRSYDLFPGDLTLFNPQQPHACAQVDQAALDYRCINIPAAVMSHAVEEICGCARLPVFGAPVLRAAQYASDQRDLARSLRELHRLLMAAERDFRKEEAFLLLVEQLLRETEGNFQPLENGALAEVTQACAYLEEHFAEAIRLDDLAAAAGLSKYHFVRTFTRQKGISPYRYLETVRIGRARRWLEQGLPPGEAALRAGFSDQSHFTNFFKRLIGLTPGQYQRIYSECAPQPAQNAAGGAEEPC
jgi:AraC-like DNA-binding protein